MRRWNPSRRQIGLACAVLVSACCGWKLIENLEAQDRAQSANFFAKAQSFPAQPALPQAVQPGNVYPQQIATRRAPHGGEVAKKVVEALDQLRSDEADDAAKDAAMEELQKMLGKLFDADLDQRTMQIEKLEEQIADLKEQIKKRRAAKERLIELRIEVLRNESEGLAFPSTWGFDLPNVFPRSPLAPIATGNYSPPGAFAPAPPANPGRNTWRPSPTSSPGAGSRSSR